MKWSSLRENEHATTSRIPFHLFWDKRHAFCWESRKLQLLIWSLIIRLASQNTFCTGTYVMFLPLRHQTLIFVLIEHNLTLWNPYLNEYLSSSKKSKKLRPQLEHRKLPKQVPVLNIYSVTETSPERWNDTRFLIWSFFSVHLPPRSCIDKKQSLLKKG